MAGTNNELETAQAGRSGIMKAQKFDGIEKSKKGAAMSYVYLSGCAKTSVTIDRKL